MLPITHADHDSGHAAEIAVQQNGMTHSNRHVSSELSNTLPQWNCQHAKAVCHIYCQTERALPVILILLLVNSKHTLDPPTLTSTWKSGTLINTLVFMVCTELQVSVTTSFLGTAWSTHFSIPLPHSIGVAPVMPVLHNRPRLVQTEDLG
jgi:hypothetical protein